MKKPIDLHVLNVKDLSMNTCNEINSDGFSLAIRHLENDPANANRVKISNGIVEVEMLPSKGFSLGQAWVKGKPLFWEAPGDKPDTETIDLLSDEIYINGHSAPGFTYLKSFIAGVELLGLRNWGMPTSVDGKFYPLHGETSNIPVQEVTFQAGSNHCSLQASFVYRTFEGNHKLPWYERGEALFKVTRTLVLMKASGEIRMEDTIENVSQTVQIPDWGYHITFMPENEARYIVPSRVAADRSGNPLPQDFETWHPALNEKQRVESGIIHKELLLEDNGDGAKFVNSLLVYPNHSAISVTTTHAPYLQTWFSCGGKGSSEFAYKDGRSVLQKNWDGMGIEIGSSSLDHDGNTDPSVRAEAPLNPGETIKIEMIVELVEPQKTLEIERKINRYRESGKVN